MGTCTYCGEKAGFLRTAHPACAEEHKKKQSAMAEGRARVVQETEAAIKGDKLVALPDTITRIESAFYVSPAERSALLIKGYELAVERFLEDGLLDEGEEARLAHFQQQFNLTQTDLDMNGAYEKAYKASLLRHIMNGDLSRSMTFSEPIPVNLQKGEKVVWAFHNTDCLEDKTRRQYVGGSQGVSVRICKGVYYRVGAFKGEAVDYTQRVTVDSGSLFVTDKNLYYVGSRKSSRMPYAKIVSFVPFSNGIGVQRDAANAKPQFFTTGDGWFSYNLISNLAQM